MRRTRLAVSALILVALAAVVVDRMALASWRWRVQRYSDKLKAVASATQKVPPSLDTLLTSTRDAGPWRVPLVEVRLEGPSPSRITVDGNGGLNLWYEPPVLAWSRHVGLGRQRPMVQGADLYSYNDVYILKVWTVGSRPDGKVLEHPSVTLDHGLPF